MTSRSAPKKFAFPRIERVILNHLSLYSSVPYVDEKFDRSVFCLAGANGLGKTTFMESVNYGLTGIVPNPSRKFESVREFYRENKGYARDYFSGRVDEEDRYLAEIILEFSIPGHRCRIRRPLFENGQLRDFLSVTSSENLPPLELVQSPSETYENDHDARYCGLIEKICGLQFPQFVFLQHLLFTFGERRHLLFWDQRVTSQALHLAFGVDPDAASHADQLRREMERSDSRVRNAQWQATKVRTTMESMKREWAQLRTKSKLDADDVADQHEALADGVAAAAKEVERLRTDYEDSALTLARASAARVTARAEYEDFFSSVIVDKSNPRMHPAVLESVQGSRCVVCGSSSAVSEVIEASLQAHQCPLCANHFEIFNSNESSRTALQAAADRLTEVSQTLRKAEARVDRLELELRQKEAEHEQTLRALRDFEAQHGLAKLPVLPSSTDFDAIMESYAHQVEQLVIEKNANRKERDRYKRELRTLERELETRYTEAEQRFVPMFRELAESFLGLDIDVGLETKGGLHLALEVEGTKRRLSEQLSESQRYFVDIALRMALSRQLAAPGVAVTLFIDTPEGSLDIAYESRAGDMFATFVEGGGRIMMTANINTSQLLLRLARRCGANGMQLIRMTEWATLSEVQLAEQQLFVDALARVEEALQGE